MTIHVMALIHCPRFCHSRLRGSLQRLRKASGICLIWVSLPYLFCALKSEKVRPKPCDNADWRNLPNRSGQNTKLFNQSAAGPKTPNNSPVFLVFKISMCQAKTYFNWKIYVSGGPKKNFRSIRGWQHPSTSADISPLRAWVKFCKSAFSDLKTSP